MQASKETFTSYRIQRHTHTHMPEFQNVCPYLNVGPVDHANGNHFDLAFDVPGTRKSLASHRLGNELKKCFNFCTQGTGPNNAFVYAASWRNSSGGKGQKSWRNEEKLRQLLSKSPSSQRLINQFHPALVSATPPPPLPPPPPPPFAPAGPSLRPPTGTSRHFIRCLDRLSLSVPRVCLPGESQSNKAKYDIIHLSS
ncbi:unnamed protein product [Protopolystoma xenopodis]|uniref:Uncharacterized protein n=1 Tax=Protopolystoma xenopodis TaxID=117903 RepID=A0A448XP24_9PLAT|nr:unnamed protein product [Protopolystoma xenopodis]